MRSIIAAAILVAVPANAQLGNKTQVAALTEARGTCAELLTAEEVGKLGAPTGPFSLLAGAGVCGLDSSQQRGLTPDFNVYLSSGYAAMARRDLAPGGLYANPRVKVTPLGARCGAAEAWTVDTPTVRILLFADGAAGGNLRFSKSVFKGADVVERACTLIAPRLKGLLAKLR
jgi:hypothetical protein